MTHAPHPTPTTPGPDPDDLDRSRYDRGAAVLRRVDGESGEQVVAALAEVAPALAHHLVAFGFGDVYARPGLDPTQRELLAVGMLTALGDCTPQLEVHVHAALNVGLTPAQIVEAITQAAVYCGFPRALNAVSAARRVFAARDLLPVAPAG